MTLTVHANVEQGSDEWLALRCGKITASEMKLILTTKTLKIADNDKSRSHVMELVAQRISGFVEPHYVSEDMLRGKEDEIIAREIYAEKFAPVREVGFMTRDDWGFVLGYSPDGLVDGDGLIEIKSRRQKFHVETVASGEVPEEYRLQIQTGLLVSGAAWCDFISICGGLNLAVIRVEPDPEMQAAIIKAAANCERQIAEKMAAYRENLATLRHVPVERRQDEEMVL